MWRILLAAGTFALAACVHGNPQISGSGPINGLIDISTNTGFSPNDPFVYPSLGSDKTAISGYPKSTPSKPFTYPPRTTTTTSRPSTTRHPTTTTAPPVTGYPTSTPNKPFTYPTTTSPRPTPTYPTSTSSKPFTFPTTTTSTIKYPTTQRSPSTKPFTYPTSFTTTPTSNKPFTQTSVPTSTTRPPITGYSKSTPDKPFTYPTRTTTTTTRPPITRQTTTTSAPPTTRYVITTRKPFTYTQPVTTTRYPTTVYTTSTASKPFTFPPAVTTTTSRPPITGYSKSTPDKPFTYPTRTTITTTRPPITRQTITTTASPTTRYFTTATHKPFTYTLPTATTTTYPTTVYTTSTTGKPSTTPPTPTTTTTRKPFTYTPVYTTTTKRTTITGYPKSTPSKPFTYPPQITTTTRPPITRNPSTTTSTPVTYRPSPTTITTRRPPVTFPTTRSPPATFTTTRSPPVTFTTTRRLPVTYTTSTPSKPNTYLPPFTTTTRRPPVTFTTTRRPPVTSTTTRSPPVIFTTTRSPPVTFTTTRRPPVTYTTSTPSKPNTYLPPFTTTTRRPPVTFTTTRRPPVTFTTTRSPPVTFTTTRSPPVTFTTTRSPPVTFTTTRRPPVTYTTSTPSKPNTYLPPFTTTTYRPPTVYPKSTTTKQVTYPPQTTTTTSRPPITFTTTRRPPVTFTTTRRPPVTYTTSTPGKPNTYLPPLTTTTYRPPTVYPKSTTTKQVTYPPQTTPTTRRPPVTFPTTRSPPVTFTTTRRPPVTYTTTRSPPVTFTTTRRPPITYTTSTPSKPNTYLPPFTTTTHRPPTTAYITPTTNKSFTYPATTTTTSRPFTTTQPTSRPSTYFPPLTSTTSRQPTTVYAKTTPSTPFTYNSPTTTTSRPPITTYSTSTTSRPNTYLPPLPPSTSSPVSLITGYPKVIPAVEFTYPPPSSRLLNTPVAEATKDNPLIYSLASSSIHDIFKTEYKKAAPTNRAAIYPPSHSRLQHELASNADHGFPSTNAFILSSPTHRSSKNVFTGTQNANREDQSAYNSRIGRRGIISDNLKASSPYPLGYQSSFDNFVLGDEGVLQRSLLRRRVYRSAVSDEGTVKYNDFPIQPHLQQDENRKGNVRRAIPGEPGRDYPVYSSIPRTSFSCNGRSEGYFADRETDCQVFHVCVSGTPSVKMSFICPNGSIFNQKLFTCDWWKNVNCSAVADHTVKSDSLETPNSSTVPGLKSITSSLEQSSVRRVGSRYPVKNVIRSRNTQESSKSGSSANTHSSPVKQVRKEIFSTQEEVNKQNFASKLSPSSSPESKDEMYDGDDVKEERISYTGSPDDDYVPYNASSNGMENATSEIHSPAGLKKLYPFKTNNRTGTTASNYLQSGNDIPLPSFITFGATKENTESALINERIISDYSKENVELPAKEEIGNDNTEAAKPTEGQQSSSNDGLISQVIGQGISLLNNIALPTSLPEGLLFQQELNAGHMNTNNFREGFGAAFQGAPFKHLGDSRSGFQAAQEKAVDLHLIKSVSLSEGSDSFNNERPYLQSVDLNSFNNPTSNFDFSSFQSNSQRPFSPEVTKFPSHLANADKSDYNYELQPQAQIKFRPAQNIGSLFTSEKPEVPELIPSVSFNFNTMDGQLEFAKAVAAGILGDRPAQPYLHEYVQNNTPERYQKEIPSTGAPLSNSSF